MTVDDMWMPMVGPDWAPAEQVAAEQRDRRMHPTAGQRRSDRVLLPIIAVAWLCSVVASVVGLGSTRDVRDELSLAASGGVLLVLALGFTWLGTSRRYLLSSSPRSIRGALPQGAWPSVRRQLAGKQPLDPEHAGVVLELAQQRDDC